MKLLVKIEAGILSTPPGSEEEFTQKADGLQSDEVFSEYIDRGYPELYSAKIRAGVLILRRDRNS